MPLWESFWDPKVLLLSLYYFGIGTASLGMPLSLPQMVKQLGLTNMQVGWVSMIDALNVSIQSAKFRSEAQMKFLVQLLLSFLAGLAIGYVLLSVWDVVVPGAPRYP